MKERGARHCVAESAACALTNHSVRVDLPDDPVKQIHDLDDIL